MKTEIKILKWMIHTKKHPTIKDLSVGIKADYKITHSATHSLLKKGVLDVVKVGKSSQLKLVPKFSQEVFIAENERRDELLRNIKFRVIYGDLSRLNFPFMALVFGSNAKGTAHKNSDIDIMIICEKNRRNDATNKLSMLAYNIHLLVFSTEEFITMIKSNELSVVKEAAKHNVILIGIEDYYRLMENVGRETY